MASLPSPRMITSPSQAFVCGNCSRISDAFHPWNEELKQYGRLGRGMVRCPLQQNVRRPSLDLQEREPEASDWPTVRGIRRWRGLAATHAAASSPSISSSTRITRLQLQCAKVAARRRGNVATRAATKTAQMARAPKFRFWTMTANSREELRAAAVLRAQLFYRYPPFRTSTCYPDDVRQRAKERVKHEYDVHDLLKAHIRSETNRDGKMEFLGMRVTCLLAVCEKSDAEALLSDSWQQGVMPWTERESHLESVLTKPPEVPWRGRPDGMNVPLVAIGTLDIQVGKNLPSEPLVGAYPRGERAAMERGYIFNVCVTAAARGRGVGTTLMEEAAEVARDMGLKALYVHVEAGNGSARRLYENLGYTIEQEEPIEYEKKFSRPRRLLLTTLLE